MFSLQITIRNLIHKDTPSSHSDTFTAVTARFGSIQTEIQMENGSGGKKLLLQIESQQMEDLIKNYAFGLFARSESDKYFAILSLQRMKIGEINCSHQIHFFNDHRQPCFQAEIIINLQHYQPKLPQRNQPHQPFNKKTVQKQKPQPQKIVSFLHGNMNKASKPPIPPQRPTKVVQKSNPTIKNVKQAQKQIRIKPTHETDLDDDFFTPPVMQFTNNIEEQTLKVPTVPQYHPPTQIKQPTRKQNNYMADNKPQIKKKTTKQQLREEARKQAEKYAKTQENIMIPMPKGDKYELVPLSSLKQTQIIDYANHQKMLQEERRKEKQLRRQLQEERKKNQQRQMRKPPQHLKIKLAQNKQESSPRVAIKEQSQERSEIQEDYESDFDSISLGNSLMRSRQSLRSSNYNLSSQKKIEESGSILDSGYSQQFDSYSQSMLSYKKRANSISEISQSMRSNSQSYKR